MTYRLALWCVICSWSVALFGQDPFAAHVRTTRPLSPQAEQMAFQLPPGFEIQLVAAEPDIAKPMNLAFDDRGRLWVTDSLEYPFAVPPDQTGRDSVKILEDTDGDGRADKITTFAEGLNIPIGLYPWKNGVVVFSIPHIWYFEDTDGDGKADRKQKLLGPFGYERDTHGLNNAFRRGYDGWLYACHGFNNQTEVSGGDGRRVVMQSGNTYRFRLDGSRIEQFTHGQVNPFGMTVDELANFFTADCHSKPIYQLLRGGYYPSFGKPHDGLGFVPPMMAHQHGSTAIAGVVYYTGGNFPTDYRGNFYSGNVMTSRINRNKLIRRGSTIIAKEQPDFVSTSDPWFRPVDVRVGPDGALYVADFYNRIIGHYEVPLDHPGRDRNRGRIWRIVYTGNDRDSQPARMPTPLTELSPSELVGELDQPVLPRRLAALNRLVDVHGKTATAPLSRTLLESESPAARSLALWGLFRLNALTEEQWQRAASDDHRDVRVHAFHVAAEMPKWSDAIANTTRERLSDDDAFVRRAAAEALGLHIEHFAVSELMHELSRVSAEDTFLQYALRQAIRNQLRQADHFARLNQLHLKPAAVQVIAEICLALPGAESAQYVLANLSRIENDRPQLVAALRHISRYIPAEQTPPLITTIRRRLRDDVDLQVELLSAIREGFAQRGLKPTNEVNAWSWLLAKELLDSIDEPQTYWQFEPIAGAPQQENPWTRQQRISSDGQTATFLSSLPRGERLTGTLRTPPFRIPSRLSFFVAGHIGPPNQPVVARNFIRLRDAKTNEILAEARPPRNDTAQKIEWDLAEHTGKRGCLELVDGDSRGAYAWLAVGRMEPKVAVMPKSDPYRITARVLAAARLLSDLNFHALPVDLERSLPEISNVAWNRNQFQSDAAQIESQLNTLLRASRDSAGQSALARALLTIRPARQFDALADILGESAVPTEMRVKIAEVIAERDGVRITETLAETVRVSPARVQVPIAQILAGDESGAEQLLQLVESGRASPRLLQDQMVVARLGAVLGEEDDRVAKLTADLPAVDAELTQLIESRRQSFASALGNKFHGEELFKKHCAACHRIGSEGSLIGPQLDGIGGRGLERIIEDVLDPNRNVDVAFRTTTLVLSSGQVVTGLVRREEGETLVLADSKGKEFAVSKSEIEQQVKSQISLMPANVNEILPEAEFRDLVTYLLGQRRAVESPSVEGRD